MTKAGILKRQENLKSLAEYTPEQRKEIAHAGGVASGQARRLKIDLHDLVLQKLCEKDLDEGGINPDLWGVNKDYGKTHIEILVEHLIKEAKGGNMQAWDRLFYYAGIIPNENNYSQAVALNEME